MRPLFALLLLTFAAQAAPAATLYGPTPYRSAADSPFDLSGQDSTFFLEDFEDGELNTPSLDLQTEVVKNHWVRPPDHQTDSVDGDDGLLDGTGSRGRSLFTGDGYVNFTDPPQYFTFATFDFDEASLGFQPNAFGFVWTDGPSNASIAIELRTKDDVRIKYFATEPYFASGLGDDEFHGETSDDTFFGVIAPRGIERVSIINLSHTDEIGGFELDHVQYGLIVPEPSTAGSIAIAFAAILAYRVVRFARVA